MKNKKVFILLPDGVGLKNFAFTKFKSLAQQQDLDLVYWNNTVFDLEDLGCKQVNIQDAGLHPLTDVYKNVRKHLEIYSNVNRFNDEVYQSYLFPFNTNSLKNKIRTVLTKVLIATHKSEEGLQRIVNKTYQLETQTSFFTACVNQLKEYKPDFVLCTNQRTSLSIAPIESAKKLGIQTGCFVFSWDNLPKAMLLIDTDYYFVWSDFMKEELLKYYPNIKPEQIYVTGTPQFENHFDKSLLLNKEEFFSRYNLNTDKKYFLYSGDDITTSPNDPLYLEDTAKAVKELNKKGHNFGILFRRCPVDFSNRFDHVLSQYNDIVSINPDWKRIGEKWNTVMPTIEDMSLQANCIYHTEGVLNLGSSMVFDAIAHNKTCAYFNYNNPKSNITKWSVEKIYKYVHFRSMPDKQAVHWVNSSKDISGILLQMLQLETPQHKYARKWFEIINQHPNNASEKILDSIQRIIQ